jgi:photosystem II stability/assembly factor-like uncharacterized protein
MRKPRPRARVAAGGLLLVAACQPAAVDTDGKVVGPSVSTAAASTTSTAATPDRPKVGSGRLSPAQVLFGQAVLVPDRAGGFNDVTPPHTEGEYVHDAYFVDRDHGWVGFTETAAASGRLVRTGDGGRTWEAVTPSAAAHHSAGSRVWLHFFDRRLGWTVTYAAAAPGGGILRTTDGGQTWSEWTELPEPGPVRFTTPTHGWLAGYSVYVNTGGLYETFDGGDSWHQRNVAPADGAGADDLGYRLPFFDGRDGVLPVSVGDDRVAFYLTADDGRTWQAASTAAAAGGPRAAVAVASRSVWWAIGSGGPAAVTTDGGATWVSRRRAGLPGTILDFEARDERTAWASAFDQGGPRRLYATSDGGETWRPLPDG